MVVRYNTPYHIHPSLNIYKKRNINRKTSNKNHIKALTPKSRKFLQSLGFKVLK